MKKFFVSLGVLGIGVAFYIIGRMKEITAMTDISTEVIGASLMAVILFLFMRD